ncbi:MAG: TetR/AcrR family transcriptional regulator [Actinomycetota bacterium]
MARPLSQEARRKAVEAAQALIGEHGIGGCTLDGVSKRSGVAKTTLYRHWGSANMLLVHSIDCSIERVPTPNTGSLRGDLFEVLSWFAAVATEPANRMLMLDVMAAAAKDPDLAEVQRSMVAERTRPLRELVQRAVDRDEIPAIDLELAAEFIEGPMLAKVLKTHTTPTADELRAVIELIARGLGATND